VAKGWHRRPEHRLRGLATEALTRGGTNTARAQPRSKTALRTITSCAMPTPLLVRGQQGVVLVARELRMRVLDSLGGGC